MNPMQRLLSQAWTRPRPRVLTLHENEVREVAKYVGHNAPIPWNQRDIDEYERGIRAGELYVRGIPVQVLHGMTGAEYASQLPDPASAIRAQKPINEGAMHAETLRRAFPAFSHLIGQGGY